MSFLTLGKYTRESGMKGEEREQQRKTMDSMEKEQQFKGCHKNGMTKSVIDQLVGMENQEREYAMKSIGEVFATRVTKMVPRICQEQATAT